MGKKRVPKHVLTRLDTMNKLMDRLVSLNVGLERWLEEQGIEDGFDFTADWRECQGYAIPDVEGFLREVERRMA